MGRVSLQDGQESYDVTAFEAREPTRVVLFAAGGGGSPERHLPLLAHLAERGCAVVAPHFARFLSPEVADEELLHRVRRLRAAVDSLAQRNLPIVGVGHSIGTTLLLGLAGGQVWPRRGTCLTIEPMERLVKLALLAPATRYFQAPGALDAVCTPILAWAGTNDNVTPPEQAEFLSQALGNRISVDVRVVQDAGHFTFMDLLPPNVRDSLPNRDQFLSQFAREIGNFVTS